MQWEPNINEDSKINPNDLDLEWREQPHLFGLYAKAHAEAIRKLAEIRAALDSEYRSPWNAKEETGWNDSWGKPSEAAIHSRVCSHPDYIAADFRANELAGNVKAMEHKKQALENLVKLAGMNWFSTPKEPKDLSRQSRFEEKVNSEEARRRVKEKLNGRGIRRGE